MCMQPSAVRPHQRWHWAGDEIVPEPVIPASRVLPGTRRAQYPIDVRQFLSIEGNAVIRRHLRALLDSLTVQEQVRLVSRQAGAFDFRARKVASYVGTRITYKGSPRSINDWCFPEETLALEAGDCEDLAFLLASLLEASGISAYCLRVALGVVQSRSADGELRRGHHAGVVYQDEGGAWQILEPLALPRTGDGVRPRAAAGRSGSAERHEDVEYIPHFVFNRHHLWRVRTPDEGGAAPLDHYVADRTFWSDFNPQFAINIHNSIYDEALAAMSLGDLETVKGASLRADVNTLAYDPRQHFDFAYVAQGWDMLRGRLASDRVEDFGYAVHAIADFYAHTLYADFADRRADGSLEVYEPATGVPPGKLVYDFRLYERLPDCAGSIDGAQAYWKGKLISGQWWRWYTSFPSDLKKAADFKSRFCLPDHDAVAVDGPTPKSDHRRYGPEQYVEQFRLRRRAAVEHIAQAHTEWSAAHH